MDSIYGPKTQSIEPSQYPITRGRLLAVGFPHFCRECAWKLGIIELIYEMFSSNKVSKNSLNALHSFPAVYDRRKTEEQR